MKITNNSAHCLYVDAIEDPDGTRRLVFTRAPKTTRQEDMVYWVEVGSTVDTDAWTEWTKVSP